MDDTKQFQGTLPPQLFTGSAVSAIGRAVGTGLSIITLGVVTRGLSAASGVSAYGSYAAVFTFLSVLAVVADGGLSLVFTRRAATLTAVQEHALLWRVLRIRLVALVLAYSIIALGVVAARYPPIIQSGIVFGSIGVAAQLISQVVMGVFQKRLRMLTPALAEIGGRAMTLAVALWATAAHGGILHYIAAFVAGTAVTVFWNLRGAGWLLTRDQVIPTAPPEVTQEIPPVRGIVREAWPLGLFLVFSLVVFRADSVLLSLLRPPEDLGWYALPYKALESLLFFPAMLGGLLFPVLSRSSAEGVQNPQRLQAVLRAATTVFLILSIPTTVLLWFGAPRLVFLLGGPAFAPSVPVLRILALALGALFFGNLYGNGAIALGAHKSLLVLSGALATLNILVNFIVIPRYSFLGAAWTTLGTEVLSAFLVGWMVLRRVPHFLPTREHWQILCAGLVLVALLLVPLPLLLRGAVALLGYAGALTAFGLLTPAYVMNLIRSQRFQKASYL